MQKKKKKNLFSVLFCSQFAFSHSSLREKSHLTSVLQYVPNRHLEYQKKRDSIKSTLPVLFTITSLCEAASNQ